MSSKKSIRTKVLGISSIIFLILGVLGVYSWYGSSQIKGSSTEINSKVFPALQFVTTFSFKVEKLKPVIETLIEEPDEDDLADFRAEGAKTSALIDSALHYNRTPDIDTLKTMFDSYIENVAIIIETKIEDEDAELDLTPLQASRGIFEFITKIKEQSGVTIQSKFLGINKTAVNFVIVTFIIFAALIGILFYFVSYVGKVAKSIKKLAGDATEIRGGNLEHVVVNDRQDEVGELQGNFDNMRLELKDLIQNLDKKVQERTKEAMDEKRKVAQLLDNMKQGVFKIDSEFKIVPPVSQFANDMFGEEIEGKSIHDVLYKDLEPRSEDKVTIDTAFIAVFGEDDLQWDLSEDNLLPRVERFTPQGKQVLRVSYAPLWDEEDLLQEIMYVVEDITELERLAAEKKKNEESIAIIQELAQVNLVDLKGYFKSSAKLVRDTQELLHAGVYDVENLGVMFRYLHTLKGNSRVFGLSLVGSAVHTGESFVNQMLEAVRAGEDYEESWLLGVRQGLSFAQKRLNQYADVAIDIFKLDLDFKQEIVNDLIKMHILLESEWENGVPNASTLDQLAEKAVVLGVDSLVECASDLSKKVVNEGVISDPEKNDLRKLCSLEFEEAYGIDLGDGNRDKVVDCLVGLEALASKGYDTEIEDFDLSVTSVGKKAELAGLHLVKSYLDVSQKSGSKDIQKEMLTSAHSFLKLLVVAETNFVLTGAEKVDFGKLIEGSNDQILTDLEQVNFANKFTIALIREFIAEQLNVAQIFKDWSSELGCDVLFSEAILGELEKAYSDITSNESFEDWKNSFNSGTIKKVFDLNLLAASNGVSAFITKVSFTSVFTTLYELKEYEPSSKESLLEVNSYKFKQLRSTLANSPSIEIVNGLVEQLLYVDVRSSFSKYKSMINEIGEKLGKEIALNVSGGGAALPEAKLNLLQDALVHMIRNSADHGLETTDGRVSAGKPTTGEISLKIKDAEGAVHIILADDGKGIDGEVVYKKALENGVVKESDNLDSQAKQELIFMANLSTKDELSDLSGRGVGMDVVKKNIEGALGGKLKLTSVLGKGTTFDIEIPL